MKYIKFLFFVLLLIFISSFCIFKAYKKQNELRIRNQYDEIVKEYRENLSPEKLEKMPYEFSKETSIQDFRFGQFCDALKVSQKGGFNHPLTLNKLFLYDMKEGTGFVFEILFALDNGKTNGVNVVLLYYEDNEYKGGYRCRCPELDAWGESIGMFQNK